jgi:hypothetical protein
MVRIDSSNVAIEGERAKVTSADPAEPPLTLVRHQEKWRVPVSEISRDVNAADLDKNLHDASEQCRLLKEIAQEVVAGKYKSAVEARQELDRRILKSAMPQLEPKDPATHAAATQPKQP